MSAQSPTEELLDDIRNLEDDIEGLENQYRNLNHSIPLYLQKLAKGMRKHERTLIDKKNRKTVIGYRKGIIEVLEIVKELYRNNNYHIMLRQVQDLTCSIQKHENFSSDLQKLLEHFSAKEIDKFINTNRAKLLDIGREEGYNVEIPRLILNKSETMRNTAEKLGEKGKKSEAEGLLIIGALLLKALENLYEDKCGQYILKELAA
ncbi:MAG: hypothetical protein ABEJ56_01745 [Candidatus Nanohaloarchaea archaeon]